MPTRSDHSHYRVVQMITGIQTGMVVMLTLEFAAFTAFGIPHDGGAN